MSTRRGARAGAVGTLIGLVPAGAVAGALLPYLDLAGWVPAVQALVPVAGVVVALLLLGYLSITGGRSLRRRDPAATVWTLVTAVAVVAMLWPVLGWPRVGPDRDAANARPAPAESAELSVLTLNTEYGQADPAQIAALVRERHVDVLFLLEATPTLWPGLRDRLTEALPYATGTLRTDAGGSLIVSAQPLTCGSAACPAVGGTTDRTGPTTFDQPVASLPDGTLVRAAHPYPPARDSGRWRAEQGELAEWIAAQQAPALVVAGDFNSGPTHPVFRAMAAGLDRAPTRGWPRTWPRETVVPPFVLIDHVLSRGRVVADEGVIAIDGSDHAAVWALLAPPGVETRS